MSSNLLTTVLIIKHLIEPILTAINTLNPVFHIVIEVNCIIAFQIVGIEPFSLELGLEKDIISKKLVVDSVARQ